MEGRSSEMSFLGPSAGPDNSWITRLVEGMASAFARGERPDAAALLARYPGLDDEAAVRLIFEEISLRREAGEDVPTVEVVARFPRWRDELAALLGVDRMMRPPAEVDFPQVGERLGDFQLLGELGRGHSGRTFLAAQPSLADRPVVLKIAAIDHDEHLSLARLQHTHIVPLYSEHVFAERGLRALCMPYLGGANFAQILAALGKVPAGTRRGRDLLRALDSAGPKGPGVASPPDPGPFRQYLERSSYVQGVCWIVACLADALQYAHDRGLVHMDVKPSNVLIGADGQAMLLDFHLARGPVPAGAWAPDRLGGTPGWMSPEQRSAMSAVTSGGPIAVPLDGRSDVFSLGLLLEEALSGHHRGDDASPRPRPDRANPGVSVGLADIVAKCLDPHPSGRYRAAELADDLRRHLSDLPLKGVPNRSPAERWRKWRRRRPHALGRGSARLALVAAALVVVGLAGELWRQRVRQVDSDLADARRLRLDGQFPEAIRSADRGLSLARGVPMAGSRAEALAEQRQLARRAAKARELHDLAERLRFQDGPTPSAADAETLARCRLAWDEARALLIDAPGVGLDESTERRARADLIEVAVVWASLRVRLAPPEKVEEAKAEARHVLDQAQAAFGPTLALRLARQSLDPDGLEARDGPDTPSALDHDQKGRFYLRGGRLEDAAREFRLALDDRPQDFWPNFYQGLCEARLRHPQEALSAFRTCVTLRPDSAACHYNRAVVLDSLGRTDEADRDYSRALELDPRLADAALNRGVLRYRAKRYRDAIDDFERALAAGPGRELSGRIYYNLALAHLARDDRPSASASLKAAVRAGDPEGQKLLRSLEARP